MPNLILIDRIFEIITNITEVTKLFKEKLNNEESINQAINEYLTKNKITIENIEKTIKTKDSNNYRKEHQNAQEIINQEIRLLKKIKGSIKDSNFDIESIPLKDKKEFLEKNLSSYLSSIFGEIGPKIAEDFLNSAGMLILIKLFIDEKTIKAFKMKATSSYSADHYFTFNDEEKQKFKQNIDNTIKVIKEILPIAIKKIATNVLSSPILIGKIPITFARKFKAPDDEEILNYKEKHENIELIADIGKFITEIIYDINNEITEKANDEITKENKQIAKDNKKNNNKQSLKDKIEKTEFKDFGFFKHVVTPLIEKLKEVSNNTERENQTDEERNKRIITITRVTNLLEGLLKFYDRDSTKLKNGERKEYEKKIIDDIWKNFVAFFFPENVVENGIQEATDAIVNRNVQIPENDYTSLSNDDLFEENDLNNEEENKKLTNENQQLQEKNQTLQQNFQNEQEKNKTLQKELVELKQQLIEQKKERASISLSNNSNSSVEINNLQRSAIPKDDGSDNTFNNINLDDIKLQKYQANNNLEEDKNDLPNFSKDKCDLKELRDTNQELTNEITLLTSQLEKLQFNDQKSQHEIMELMMELQNTTNDLEKLHKIIDKPKTTIETQTEQKLSIIKQIRQFFSELLESLSKVLTSLGKGISSKLSEFSYFNCKTQNL